MWLADAGKGASNAIFVFWTGHWSGHSQQDEKKEQPSPQKLLSHTVVLYYAKQAGRASVGAPRSCRAHSEVWWPALRQI
jgi:hypothetical protein